MKVTQRQLRQIIHEEILRETTYRFPTGSRMLRGRTADITYDHGMRQTLDLGYNAREDMSRWAAIPAAPGSPSDTMGFRDQEEDLLKMDPAVVAAKIIRTWGSEDTLNALDILKDGLGSDEDYHEAMIWLEDMLKTTVRMNPDPYNRNLTPREQRWIERTIGETYRQAAAAEGMGGFDPRRTMGRHFGPKVTGVNESAGRERISSEAHEAAEYALRNSELSRFDVEDHERLVSHVNSFLDYLDVFEAQSGGPAWFDFYSAEGNISPGAEMLARDVAMHITGRDFGIESSLLRHAFKEMLRILTAEQPYDHHQDLDAIELEQMFGPTAYRRAQMLRRGERPHRR